jgi:preprotein translocase subunit SecD
MPTVAGVFAGHMQRRIVRLAALLLLLLSCQRGEAPTSSSTCALNDDGGVLDVSGRIDGLYGVVDDRVGATPMARFERMTRTGSGVDAQSGKRWIGLHLADPEARAVEDFTASPPGRGIAVVVGGQVACRHKIRQTITTADMQVSCCDPRACDRWEALLASRSPTGTTTR